ncbi:MAG TPA: hypothetical protein PLM07_14245 [Candidatus Rifleibacterium sp.]|nr:hypothetical protein [Candidatus Rifleibacterium sp.]
MQQGIDPTGEVPEGGLKNVKIDFTTDPEKLRECRFIIVAVPTPVDRNKRPDLTPLVMSSTTVGKYIPKGAVVVYESTVAPGRADPLSSAGYAALKAKALRAA